MQKMGEKWEARQNSRREMGNEMEFETRNGCKWETRRYRTHHFSMKNEKNREKTGKTGEKY